MIDKRFGWSILRLLTRQKHSRQLEKYTLYRKGRIMTMKFEDQKVTIYTRGELEGNIVKTEAKLHEIFEGSSYAQYRNAIKMRFTGKHKRQPETKMLTHNPYAVVVLGWERPDPKTVAETQYVNNAGEESDKITRYVSFDDRYATDFDELVDGEKLGEVLFDARYTKGYSCH